MAKSNPVLESGPGSALIPMQETSLEIWDSKYRLKSKDGAPIDGMHIPTHGDRSITFMTIT